MNDKRRIFHMSGNQKSDLFFHSFHTALSEFFLILGMGGPGYRIKGEFSHNGFKNDLKHERGVLSMARSMMPDTAGSQFFIMHAKAKHLDGEYAAFGMVIEGMDVVDEIANTATDYNDRPKAEQKMKKVTAETFGVDYPEPKKF